MRLIKPIPIDFTVDAHFLSSIGFFTLDVLDAVVVELAGPFLRARLRTVFFTA